jgi:hypothetical protein
MLRRWPPAVWILVFVASELILNGGHPTWHPGELVAGLVLASIAFGLALWLAAGPWRGHPKPRGLYWLIGFTTLCYGLAAVAAGVFAGAAFAVAALAAAIIPLTAVALWIATARAKTVEKDGRLRDVSADDHEDPFPGVGLDQEVPLGDTPELHDDLDPHDLPKDHPGRKAAEHLAERR